THGYFEIDLDIVWNTVMRDLPELQQSVTQIRAELDSEAEDSGGE
ncbi:MAG: HepT-like ribonuclease domain-containing protein, partial [Streptosporangiaceae bacterium]